MRVLLAVLAMYALVVTGEPRALWATPSPGTPIKVGMLLPLSGGYAAIGADNRQGIELALTEIGEDSLLPVFGDSRTEPSHAINEFKRLVHSDGVQAVFAFRGPIGMAVNPFSRQLRVPLLGGVGNKQFTLLNEYAFQVWPPSDQEGEFIATTIQKIGGDRVGIVTAQDDWTKAVSDALRAILLRDGISVVFDEDVSPPEHDFRALVARLRHVEPGIIFVNVGISQIGPLIRQLREAGLRTPIISNFWINKPEVIQFAGSDALEDVMFAEMSTELPALRKETRRRYGNDPSGATISAYVATMFLAQAARGYASERGRRTFSAQLREIRMVRTKNGDFPVRDRIVQLPIVMRVFRGGEVTDLSHELKRAIEGR